jgi:hypothetical protein
MEIVEDNLTARVDAVAAAELWEQLERSRDSLGRGSRLRLDSDLMLITKTDLVNKGEGWEVVENSCLMRASLMKI